MLVSELRDSIRDNACVLVPDYLDAWRNSHPSKAIPDSNDVFKIYLKNPQLTVNSTDATRRWVAVLAVRKAPKAEEDSTPTRPNPAVSRASSTTVDEPSFLVAAESRSIGSVEEALKSLLEITADFLSDRGPVWGNDATPYKGGRFSRDLLSDAPAGANMI